MTLLRPRLALLPLALVFVVAACADDAPLDPDHGADDGPVLDDPSALEDELLWNEDVLPPAREDDVQGRALKQHLDGPGVGPTSRSYEITLENLTPNTGDGGSQVFSPPVIATHGRGVAMFRVGRFATKELALIAEDAMNQPMVDGLSGLRAVHEVQVGDGVIPPGASATYHVATRAGARTLSMAFMLVNTNDGFSGVDRLHLPPHGELEIELHAYDAGSEENDELVASIPGPCCGNVGTGTPTRERIAMHPGILGVGDLDPQKWGWEGPVARLTVRRLEPAYELELRNLTPDTGDGGSQVFSPPVFASHAPSVRMFRFGRFASDELAGIAEDAMNQPMVDLLEASGRARDVQVGGGVIPPGASDRYVLESGPGTRRLSMAFMLVNTNDAFSGVDALRLPRYGAVTYRLRAFDAGSEENDELVASIPGPCCGNVGTGTPTRERILLHPGIRGVGDLDPGKWGWEEPAAELTVTRIR